MVMRAFNMRSSLVPSDSAGTLGTFRPGTCARHIVLRAISQMGFFTTRTAPKAAE